MISKKIKNITPVKIHNPKTVDLYSPWDLKKIAKIECINKSNVNQILDISSNAFLNREKFLSKIERIKILKKSKSLLLKNSKKFSEIIAFEGGKPLKDSKIEVARAINGIELCIEAIKKYHGTEIPMNLNNAS